MGASRVLGTIDILIAVCLISFPAQAKYSGGTGEPNDPYEIATAEDLMLLGETPEDYDKHFILTADIDLHPNQPAGILDKAIIAPDADNAEYGYQGTPFTGVFDGNSCDISHMTMEGEGYLGLFGELGSGATVRNLGLDAANVYGTGHCVGGLAGINRGSVTNFYVTGTVTGDWYVGGLAGSNNLGTITASHSSARVTGGGPPHSSSIGGLVGENSGRIKGSYSIGTVGGGNYDVGGLVGRNSGAVIDCNSTCSVTGEYLVGGLIGDNYGAVFTCHAVCPVTGSHYVGGLGGRNMGNMVNCYSAGVVDGNEAIGGLVGINGYYGVMPYPGYIDDCYSLVSVEGEVFVGGLVGDNRHGDVTQCYSTGMVNGESNIGGLAGYNASATVAECYSAGVVSGGENVGGLVGGGFLPDVTVSFWDIQTSGQSASFGGIGKTTVEMQTATTFLDAGWDFSHEAANGTADIWSILEGESYPRLYWELIRDDPNQTPSVLGKASGPYPADGAVGVEEPSMAEPFELAWTPGAGAVAHNVYLGTDIDRVNQSNADSIPGALIFQNLRVPELRLWTLERGKTYYWRIDEIGSDGTIVTGDVWSFTTALQPRWWKGRACFTGETPVWIDGNPIPMSNVVAGQVVRYGEDRNEVEELQVHDGVFTCYDIGLETGNTITVAECHYFMTDTGQWLSVHDIKNGTRLKASKNIVSVTTVARRPKPYVGEVFNLKVKNGDRYLVGKDAIVVRDY